MMSFRVCLDFIQTDNQRFEPTFAGRYAQSFGFQAVENLDMLLMG